MGDEDEDGGFLFEDREGVGSVRGHLIVIVRHLIMIRVARTSKFHSAILLVVLGD